MIQPQPFLGVLLHAIGDAVVDSDSRTEEIRAAIEESRR